MAKKEFKVGEVYTYLLPYITGVETSISKNGIIDNLYYVCIVKLDRHQKLRDYADMYKFANY